MSQKVTTSFAQQGLLTGRYPYLQIVCFLPRNSRWWLGSPFDVMDAEIAGFTDGPPGSSIKSFS